MRLIVFNCLLLASVAVALPNGRHQRDLAYLKNLVTSTIFEGSQVDTKPAPVLQEENEYKLFQLPGYEKPVVEEFVYAPAVEKVNLNAFGAVVGAKSKDDTLVAVKDVNNLLSTGILYGGQNNVMKETVVPMFPSLNTLNYVVEEKVKTAPVNKTRPVLTEVIETTPVLTDAVETRPVLTEVVETRPVLTEVVETRPVFTEVIRPVEEKVELMPFEPTYFYKKNEPVITYTAHNNPGVELVETIKTKTELPMSIKKRVEEAIVLGAVPNRIAPVQEVFQYQSPPVVDFSYPRVKANAYVQNSFGEEVAPVQEVYQYQSPSFVEFSYPSVEANAYVQNSFREEVTPVQEVYQYQSPSFVEFSYPKVEANAYLQNFLGKEVAPVQEIYQYQSPSFVEYSYPRIEANSYVQNLFLEEVTKESDLTNGFGLISQWLSPLKYIPVHYHLRPTMTKAINPRPHKPLHSEEVISASKEIANPPTKKVQPVNNLEKKDNIPHTLSEYIKQMYDKGRFSVARNGNKKQIKDVPIVGSKDNVSNANIPSKFYKLQGNPNTGKVVKDAQKKPNTNQHVNGPAVNSGTAKKDTAQIKNVVYTNKVAAKPQTSPHSVVVASTNAPKQPLRENNQTAVKDTKNYSNQHKNADGSYTNVNDNKHEVSVSVNENNNRGRGDIPDQ